MIESIITAAVVGIVTGVVSTRIAVAAMSRDIHWIGVALKQLQESVDHAHQRIDRINTIRGH